MADVNRGNRPLSPHIQIYRPQINTITSILTRITGNGLILGALLITWWLVAAATGPEAFQSANGVLTSWLGDVVMFLSLWALWYHSLSGLRHLLWDFGYGVEARQVHWQSWTVIGGSVILTIVTVLLI